MSRSNRFSLHLSTVTEIIHTCHICNHTRHLNALRPPLDLAPCASCHGDSQELRAAQAVVTAINGYWGSGAGATGLVQLLTPPSQPKPYKITRQSESTH